MRNPSRPLPVKQVQFYSGNFLNGVRGKDGAVYNKHAALCLETQVTLLL